MVKSCLTIGIAGAGGDGVVVMGSLLQRLAALQGYFSQMPRYYGAQIRGGGSGVKLTLDSREIPFPRDSLDILVCFNWDKYFELENEMALRADSLVLYESPPSREIRLPDGSCRVDFSGESKKLIGSPVDKNIVSLGLLTAILGLDEERVRKAIDLDPKLRLLKKNLRVLEAGMRMLPDLTLPGLRLAPPSEGTARLIIHGNAAVARGALRAGCRAYFGYPITPAAEVMQQMDSDLTDGVFLQAEDEIASAGLAIGASLAGAKAVTGTSGPGLDLMTESMGLALAAEVPMVIVDVQRCGPSTGIPSKSEQSDLNHAIYGGHGDAPRVVLAPYDVEGCYRLAIESLNVAEYYQTVVILLSDQWLGQTFVATGDTFLTEGYPIIERKKPAPEDPSAYHRYGETEDFISPMANVGDEGRAYRTTGLTHNEDGAPAFDFETNQRLHEKIWNKLQPLRERDDLVRVFGPEEPSRGIISWGSSAQAVLETVKELGLQDELAVCVPELLYPLPGRLERFAASTERLLVVEMNFTGQLYHHLRSLIDLPGQTRLYSRAGGRPFSIAELTGPIAELMR